MSVSIALLPVALAMRIVMGKDRFESWVKSQQVVVPTRFTQERDLLIAVKRAGYDATKYGASIKTHLDGSRVFFFWELIDGRWCAVFARGHDQAMLDRFRASVEAAAGSKVFENPSDVSTVTPVDFPTNFRDGDLLVEALSEFGAHATRTAKGDIVCKIDGSTLRFRKLGDGPYTVRIDRCPSMEEAYRYLDDIESDYRRCVQEAVYEKVKQRASTLNMIVEAEEVLPDKTIVLTLRIE